MKKSTKTDIAPLAGNNTNVLTGKQRVFINAYLTNGFNATEAARIAGYKGNNVTLAAVGYENLRKPQIASEIAQRINEHCASANEVLDVLTKQMRGSLADVIGIAGDPELADELKKAGVDKLLKKHKIRRTIRTTKDGETIEDVTHEFEIHDPQAAAVHIGKHHKLFTEKHEVGGIGGGQLQIEVEFIDEKSTET